MKIKRGRPLKGDQKRVRASFTLPPDELDWLKEKALQSRTTQSELLERLLAAARWVTPRSETGWRQFFPVTDELLYSFCKRYRISRLSLFGSILRSNFGPKSDVDLLVKFEKGHEPGFFEMAQIQKELSPFFGRRKIDLRTVDELSPYFRSEVLDQAEVLYAA